MRAVLVALAVLAALMLVVRWLEPRLVFFPSRGETDTPADRGVAHRTLEVRTGDGERLAAWWLTHPDPRADVVYFHGNGGNLSLWLDVYVALQQRGLNVLAFDYRGYGLSTGSPTEEGLLRDTEAVLAVYARELAGPGRRVIYWGRSIGAVPAAYATAVQPPAGLVLESPFPDKASIIRRQPLLRFLNLFSRYRLSPLRWLERWRGPTLVLHGDRDSVVPFALGEELFAQLSGDKRFVRLAGADHNDMFGPDVREYWGAVDAFIRSAAAR